MIQLIKKTKEVYALVLGDYMLDEYIMGDVKRISPEAPVPVVEVRKKEIRLGGAGNVVNNLFALGAKSKVLGCIGKDNLSQILIKELEAINADVSHLGQVEGYCTILKTRIVSKNQQFIRYDQEQLKNLSPQYINFIQSNLDEIFKDVNVVIISDYGKGTVTEELCQKIITKAKTLNLPVIIDPKGADYTKYKGATICTPNLSELSAASNQIIQNDNEEMINQYGQKICKEHKFNYLLVTRSEKGMSLIDKEKKLDFPAMAKEVIDVTGAGDTVVSVIALGMAIGMTLPECCKLGNCAASIVISKFGAATTTINEVLGSQLLESGEKIISPEKISLLIAYLKEQGQKIVFTNGCFDLVHAGHISSFEQAKQFGDVLIVGLNGDESIKRIKGEKRPIVEEKYRAKLLSSLSLVDYVVIFKEDTPQDLIEMIKPDILVKGKDWEGKNVAGQEFVESYGGKVQFIDLEQGLSTTNIINKICKVHEE